MEGALSVFQSFVLGIVQGLGEFLPISSSAHLILIPWLLGWEDGGLTFDVALHFGTLVALLFYFRKDWIRLLRSACSVRSFHPQDPDQKLVVYLVLATIPGALMGLALEKKAEHTFRAPTLIAVILAAMGVVLWLIDRVSKKNRDLQGLTLKDALFIGFAQGFAVIPGISRSGITITAALARGLDRESAARFSFLLSFPIIAGACLLKLRHLTSHDLTVGFLTGVLAAGISGFFAIGGLIRFLQTRSYGVFAAYRVLFGFSVLLVFLLKR